MFFTIEKVILKIENNEAKSFHELLKRCFNGITRLFITNYVLRRCEMEIKKIVQELLEANTMEGLDQLCDDNLQAHMPMFPTVANKEGFLGFAKMLFTAFPDLSHKVEFQVAENDYVTTYITVSGTHKGNFNGIEATGNKVVFADMVVVRMVDNKAVELWAQFDVLALLGQLGLKLF